MTEPSQTTDSLRTPLDAGAQAVTTAAVAAPALRVDPVAEPAVDDEDVVADPNASRRHVYLVIGVAVAIALGSLLGPISASGIWEPPELRSAEFARRIAVALLGAKNLIIEGAMNAVPTAGEIGRGELPLTSIALGFRLFGLSEWAGRLPMALWGLLGLGATYVLLARLADRVAGAFAVIVLSTSPLYFLQARTMLGDIVTMASLAVAVTGLALATFDERARPGIRVAWFLFGAAGMAAGFGSRGVILGIALPALAIGCSFLLVGRGHRQERLGGIFAALSLVLGVATVALGLWVLLRAEDHQYARLLGCTIEHRRSAPTHDAFVLQLGHALFPWSAVVPFALGRMLRPPAGISGDALARESNLRLVLLVVTIFAFGAYSMLAPWTGVLPFGASFALAATTALAFRDFERGAPGSRTVALGVAALLVLFYTDFKNFPEKGLAPFVVDDARFPDSFKEASLRIIELGTVASAGFFALFFFEREEGQAVFDRREHARFLRKLRATYDGNVVFGLVALEVSLVILSIVTVISDRWSHWRQIETMALPARQAAKYGFLSVPVLVLLPNLTMLVRDACRLSLRRLRVTRASAALLAVATFGAVMSFAYYPLLARQISPKEVFESFQRLAHPGEELAMVGAGAGSGGARYYAHRDVRSFASSQEAFNWLTEREGERRWLVVRASDIAQLNSQFRGRKAPARNLPVLDARSSEILLVSNLLRPGEANENLFTKWLPDSRPSPSHPLDIDFNGQLHGLGWEVTTKDGEPATWVRAGKPYLFHFYYEVTRPIAGEWQTFIHVDGYQRRYNGDHDTLEGKYPFRLWRQGDFIEDIHPFELEPNFAGGTYTVFFGLFRGDQRLEVKRGASEDNRVNGGPLEVR